MTCIIMIYENGDADQNYEIEHFLYFSCKDLEKVIIK